MKYRLILSLLLVVVVTSVQAAKDPWYTIPDFTKIPADTRYDTINEWYLSHLTQKSKDIESRNVLLESVSSYIEETNDPITKVSLTFFMGHYYRTNYRNLEKGKKLINEAIDMARKYNLQYEWACFVHDVGIDSYYFEKDEAKALENMFMAYEVLLEMGIDKKPAYIAASNYDLAYLYYHLRNYGGCIDVLLPSLPFHKEIAPRVYLQINNTLGLAYRELGSHDSAIYYFRKVLQLANERHDYTWMGIASGNIGSIHLQKQMYDSALIYSTYNYNYVKDRPYEMSGVGIAEALLGFAEVNMALHKPDIVLAQLARAETLLKSAQSYFAPNFKELMFKVFKTRSQALAEKGNYAEAHHFNERAVNLYDTLIYLENTSLYTKVQVQLKATQNIARIKNIEAETKLSVQRRNFLLIIFGLSGLILFSLYKRQQLRNKKNTDVYESRAQLFLLEKTKAEEQLKDYITSLTEKNTLIEEFQEKIEQLKIMPQSNERLESIETLEKLKQVTIITEDDWLQFKSLFEKVYRGFFTKLKEKYPDVTPAEMRLMALVKLNISTKQMAGMLGVSPDSIRKTGYRFLKKIDTGGEADLSEIVKSL